ncbi:hypothetical protein GGQ00_003036 [Salinibacter ruber]|uniref:hypothetical protein n=1 Tax=Salinibacter ruber TaxID=146919 RepID=UPI002168B0F0|nr:hypothetical protein [Salinibacter ruber]MCS4044576.1 hypothetical protein [Salinibacter ruber]
MSEQDRTKRLDHFLNDLAEATSKDEEIADHQLRSRGIDPDVCGKDLVTMKRRILAQAKAQEEHQIREGVKSGVEARVQELMEKFGSAIEALRHGLEEDRLSHQYRNLESEPTEDEAKQMLREEIELKLSDED